MLKKIIIILFICLIWFPLYSMDIDHIFSLQDICENASLGFVVPHGAYYYLYERQIFVNYIPDEDDYYFIALFTIKNEDSISMIDINNIHDIRLYLDIVELENYPLLWLRVGIVDSQSINYKSPENPDGATVFEWVIDIKQDMFIRDINALTTTEDALFIIWNASSDDVQTILHTGIIEIEENKEKIDKVKTLLATTYKNSTHDDFINAVYKLKQQYPLYIDLDE